MEKPSCEGCRRLEARVAELEALIRDLQARLKLDATNSSLPPSANPPQGRTPLTKKKTGRPRGGQPGHQAHLRARLPAERLHEVIAFVPETCHDCGAPLPQQAGPNDPEPTWHQYAELPAMAAQVTEYQGQARTCVQCGHITRAVIPEAVRAHSFGPRLSAAITYFIGRLHVSRRDTEEAVETLFEVPLSLGTISNLEQQMAAALAPAHAEAQRAVQEATVKHVDETGWKQAGQKRWLWAAATAKVACFVLSVSRGLPGLLSLLGKPLHGILCSDRWSVYSCWDTRRRQVCWAHLKRDFQKLVDRGGVACRYGRLGLAVVELLFHEWRLFRGGGSREDLQRELEPVRSLMRDWLGSGARCRDRKTAVFCQNLLDVEPALWTFLCTPEVEPTNNHAERILRKGVLWRKNAFGCQSEEGCRFVERMLTVTQTLRLQERPVFAYLTDAIAAHRANAPIPQLLS